MGLDLLHLDKLSVELFHPGKGIPGRALVVGRAESREVRLVLDDHVGVRAESPGRNDDRTGLHRVVAARGGNLHADGLAALFYNVRDLVVVTDFHTGILGRLLQHGNQVDADRRAALRTVGAGVG